MQKGYVQIYTGNGKGKTTASMGLIIRAVGAGKKVFFGQFMKDGNYSEIKILKDRFPEVTVEQFGTKGFIFNRDPNNQELEKNKAGYEKALNAIISNSFDIVILDEINVAQFMDLITLDEVIDLINKKPNNVELILTGRYANPKIMEMADLVTEMKEIKHYFNDGVNAREGIEL